MGSQQWDYRAQQMNAVLNTKSAEKRLQFGVKRCKTMIISKSKEIFPTNQLTVDNWNVEHVENSDTGNNDLVETFQGLVVLEQTDIQKYLGFTLSSKGNNLINITEMKNKSIWIIKKIFTRLESLNLKKYYFECAMIFLNVMLRSSIHVRPTMI